MARTEKSRRGTFRPDLATIGGIVVALAGIIGGLLLERGTLADVAQPTAALIVLGGTFGAVLVSTPMGLVGRAFKRLEVVLFERSRAPGELIDEIIGYATTARRHGLVALESETDNITDPFLEKALALAVDGTDITEIRKMLDLDIALNEHRAEAEARVFESAGGYSPTIGIIGAVLATRRPSA
jgi:chemotaxis protein MotA